jgi:hypothetical protein
MAPASPLAPPLDAEEVMAVKNIPNILSDQLVDN